MIINKISAMFIVSALLLASVAMAQDSALPASPTPMQSQPAKDTAASPSSQQSTASMQNMDKMATTVTRAADTCEMMMKKEMAAAPFKKAAGLALGLLFLTALVLFVILEVQWVIYWSRLLKAQKRGDRP